MSETIKARDILALAEGHEAMLIGRGWEVPGFWRWETTARGRRVRAYFDTSDRRRRQRIPARDAPTMFRPFAEVGRPPAPDPRPQLESPFDIGKALAAFEARLHLAIRVDDALPDRERGMLKVRILWPATTRTPGDYPTGIATPFRPTRRQVDDWFETMSAISGVHLCWRSWLALWMRARGASFRTIATEVGRNEARTRTLYRTAIAECWRAVDAKARPADDRRVRRLAPHAS